MRGASLARICALALALAAQPIGSGAHAEAVSPAELVSSAEPVPPAAPVRIGDALTLEGWSVSAAPGSRALVTCEAGEHGSAIRVDYDMGRAGSFVILRKTVDLALPGNFAFSFRLRGEAPRATLEFKVVDGAENVWWRRYPDFAFAPAWQPMVVRRSRLLHAWGPRNGGGPREARAVEIALNGGAGGAGTFWVDRLVLEPREPAVPDGQVPAVSASSFRPGFEPARVADGSPATGWKSAPQPGLQWLQLDFGRAREYGGFAIDWDAVDYAVAYEVQASSDGNEWRTVHRTSTGTGGRDYVYTPDAESRYVRLALEGSSRGRGFGVADVAVEPVEFSESPNAFFAAIAREAPPGWYPKYLRGEQTYWTVVGLDRDSEEALVNEEGMVEVGRAFSVEPFLYTRGSLVTWHDVEIRQELADGVLPVPTVEWRRGGLGLRVTAFVAGERGAATLYLRYRVENHGGRRMHPRLFLAVRPFQVLPPWQALNIQGGVASVHELRFDGRAVWVDRRRAIVPLGRPASFGAATFEDGRIGEFLVLGETPEQAEVSDPFGFASGALAYDFSLSPGAAGEVALAVPLHGLSPEPLPAGTVAGVATLQAEVERAWRRRLGPVELLLPPGAASLARTARSTVAYILVNRDGAGLQPGSRTYARSWIRDGAMSSEALLQMGLASEVRRFLRWYARHQAPDGRIPCCIDARGPDWTPEHDAEGAFVYALGEYYRYARDARLVQELWPNVVRAVEHVERLRAERMTPAWRTPEQRAYFGLLPESISHEGYSGRPVHSYWDDFFALRGLKDAAALAAVVGDGERAGRFARLRDDFRATLLDSLAATMEERGLDYLPGSVELGDFDPTSTSIAVVPGGELERLPADAVRRTFERYWEEIETRIAGVWGGEAYSPYELRNVGTFLRLGWRERAHALLDLMMQGRRPAAWNAWAEVVWRDRTLPRFIGDMPHTWVGAGFVQSVRALLAFEREADQALVLAAGVKPSWLAAGVGVRRLPTHWGVLDYTMQSAGPDTVRVRLGGDLVVPPGRIVITSPLDRPIVAATVDGRPVAALQRDALAVDAVPAEVELRY